MVSRPKIPKKIETEVLSNCLRRCCICYLVDRVFIPKKGQIAHLNKRRSDNRLENLAYLCFDHHDAYDSTTSQSKNFTPGEVAHYREMLLLELSKSIQHAPTGSGRDTWKKRNEFMSVEWVYSEPWPGWPLLFPYKSPNLCDGVCRIEKIDLTDGRVVIICEQVEGNPGMSITNAVEAIALQVCQRYEIEPSSLVWIEHYDPILFGRDEWNLVEFDVCSDDFVFEGPSWRTMTKKDWKGLKLELSLETNATVRESHSRISRCTETRA